MTPNLQLPLLYITKINQAFMNTVMNLQLVQKAISLLPVQLLASQGLCILEVVEFIEINTKDPCKLLNGMNCIPLHES